MNADGTRDHKLINPKHASYEVAGIARFTAHNLASILWRKKHGSKAYLWHVKSDGTRSSTKLRDSSSSYEIVSLSDFDHNGVADIMWRKGNKSSLWFMKTYNDWVCDYRPDCKYDTERTGYKKLITMPASFKVQK